MSPVPVSVSTLPGDDIFPDVIDTHAAALFRAGAKVAARGERVNAHWKKLSASYGAPETEALVAKMGPAERAAARYDHRTAKATSALETFADEARAIKVRAEAIRARGNAFLNGVVKHGIDHEVFHQSPNDKADTVRKEHLEWYQDDAAVAENKAIFDAIKVLANDLEAAEAKCANAITTAVGAEPVTKPGTSIDWTKVPAGTPTPWGTELSQRTETDAEAQVRGFYERPIGLVNLLLAANGVSNKTLNFDDINNFRFDPTAFDFSLKLRAQTEQAMVQSGLGLLVLSSPVLGSLTLANLKSKNWFGSFSRATSGVVVKGGAAYLDQWKTDPQAARGGLLFDALTMFIPGGPEVLLPAKAGARVAEDVAGAGLRTGTTDTARAGAKVEVQAGRNGLPHVPGGLEARNRLGHAEVPDGVDKRPGAATKELTNDDFTLERGPAESKAPTPRTPPVHVPEPVRVPEPARVPASDEHHAPRFHEEVGEPKVVEHERGPAKVGATAEHRTPDHGTSGAKSVPERELVHSRAPERPGFHERSAPTHDGGSGGGTPVDRVESGDRGTPREGGGSDAAPEHEGSSPDHGSLEAPSSTPSPHGHDGHGLDDGSDTARHEQSADGQPDGGAGTSVDPARAAREAVRRSLPDPEPGKVWDYKSNDGRRPSDWIQKDVPDPFPPETPVSEVRAPDHHQPQAGDTYGDDGSWQWVSRQKGTAEQSFITGRELVDGKELEYIIPRPGRNKLPLDEFWRDAGGQMHLDEIKGNMNYLHQPLGKFRTPEDRVGDWVKSTVRQSQGQFDTIGKDAQYRIILTRNPELVEPLEDALLAAGLPHEVLYVPFTG